jgi:hypothetical protein
VGGRFFLFDEIQKVLYNEGMNTYEYLYENRSNFTRFFSACQNFGTRFNENDLKAVKSHLLSKCLEKCFPEMKYADKAGYDFVRGEEKIENKNGETTLYHPVAKKTGSIILKNFQGNQTDFTKTFDGILITQTKKPFSAAWADFDVVKKYINIKSATITIQIPFAELKFFVQDQMEVEKSDINVEKMYFECIEKIVSDICR